MRIERRIAYRRDTISTLIELLAYFDREDLRSCDLAVRTAGVLQNEAGKLLALLARESELTEDELVRLKSNSP